MKTLGIVISTPGRQSLARTLTSILYQRESVEDVLIVGDGFNEGIKALTEWYAGLGLPCRYVATVKTRDWGHTQVNYGLRHVKGDFVTYQDDDDIYLPRALDEMARLVSDMPVPLPLIGRVKTPQLGLLWQRPNITSCLDGHCLVMPNVKRKLGWMHSVHHGDQCFLQTSLRNYKEWAWTDRIWTLTRPHWTLDVWDRQLEAVHLDGTPLEYTYRFRRDGDFVTTALLSIAQDPVYDRVIARLKYVRDGLTEDEMVNIVEFAMYAAQGNDCWFRFDSKDDTRLIAALTKCNFKEHTPTEYTHDWPPDFWAPVTPFEYVTGDSGERVHDYRDDVWGGRSVS